VAVGGNGVALMSAGGSVSCTVYFVKPQWQEPVYRRRCVVGVVVVVVVVVVAADDIVGGGSVAMVDLVR
jgi:hypothetical protein